MRINEFAESQQSCPECGGPAFGNLLLAEKQDACYAKVKSRYKVWPSAYASGALVQCRKKGAANWGNKSEDVAEAVPYALSAANANAEYERTKTFVPRGYKGRVDTEVSGQKEYRSVMAALQKFARAEDQHIESGLSGTKMSVFSKTMDSEALSDFIDMALEEFDQGVAEGTNDYFKRRKDEEDRIAGTKAPAKRTPRQTDYEKKRKQQGVAEGSQQVDSLVTDALKIMRGSDVSDAVQALKTVLGDREYNSRRGHYNFYIRQLMDMYGQQGVAEAFGLYGPFTVTINTGERPQSRTKTKKFKREDDAILWAQDWLEDAPQYVFATAEVTDPDGNVVWTTDEQGVAEAYNAEYDDEAGMADNNLETLERAVQGIDELISAGDNLPEWCQEKIAVSKSMLVTVWDYMKSEEDRGANLELAEEFDLIESIVDRIAAQNRVDAEMVWEDLESLSNDELYAFAVTSQLNEDWSKVNKKDRTDGMSQKAVNAYRRENPGSKLKTAVTTKPSKLKKGSKASKRRKSYCSRSKGQMNMHNISCAKTPDKAICKARRRWNC